MGNSQSLKIIFDSDKQDGVGLAVARAGAQMRGKVVLKLDEIHRGLSLSLTFKGSECTYSDASRGRVGLRKNLARQHDFFEKKVVLFDENSGEIEPGTITFPFEIDLPNTLPTSTKSKAKWKIKYTLSSRIADAAQDHAQLSEHECKRTIIVLSAPLPDERVPKMAEPVTSNIVARGSVKKGTVSLGARVVNSNIGRGEDLKVSIACRNHSMVDISQVKVQVVQEEVWLVNQRGTAERKESIILECEDVDLPSLLKRRQKDTMLTRNTDSEENDEVYQEIRKDLMSRLSSRNTMHLSIPKCTPKAYFDTYLGKIVQVSHFVKISLVIRAVKDHPFVQIPIRIGMSPPPSTTATLVSSAAIHPATAATTPMHPPQDEIPLVDAVIVSARTNESGAPVAASAPAEVTVQCWSCELLRSSVEYDDENPTLITGVMEEMLSQTRATIMV